MPKVIRLGEKQAPKFPSFDGNGFRGFLASLLSILLWIGLLIIFVVSFYTQWFNRNFIRILQAIKPRPYTFPFLAGLLCVIFAFPVTLIVILIGEIVKR